MYSPWKLSAYQVCYLRQLELTVIIGQFALLFLQVYMKVSKQVSMQVGGHGSNQVMATM